MMSENKVGTYRFVAEPFHCDFSGKLTMIVPAFMLPTGDLELLHSMRIIIHGYFPV